MTSRLVVTIAVLASATAVVAQSHMRPGQWEVAMQMQLVNPPMQMPEMKTTQCVTPEQVKDPASTLPSGGPQGRGGKNDCKVEDYKVSGGNVTWKMVCTAPQAMTGNGDLTFTNDSYTGTMKMETPQGAMSMKLAGKRLGDCTK
jgi:hypothetical protein